MTMTRAQRKAAKQCNDRTKKMLQINDLDRRHGEIEVNDIDSNALVKALGANPFHKAPNSPQWGKAIDVEFDVQVKLKKHSLKPKETPTELLMPLLPFQKEWLDWSLKQEAGDKKGGILADEMGMGKTIQAISLIVVNSSRELVPPKVDSCIPSSSHDAMSSSVTQLPQVKATLVICPLVAIIQWQKEVERFTTPDSVKTLVYYGPQKSIELVELAHYDIVLTTYSTLETEYRKHVLPPKDLCKWCGKLYYGEQMARHLKYYCGPDSTRTSKQAKQEKRTTPPKLQSIEKDITRCVKSAKQVFLANIDENVEMSTGKMQGALEKASAEKASTLKNMQGVSILHSVKWQRIVLDEAHTIKERKSKTTKAAFALQAEYRWALSGTPLQNRVGELYSLIRFLRVDPFSYYFCEQCDCKSLDYHFQPFGQEGACECGHPPLKHYCWWNKFISNPMKRKWESGQEKAMRILEQDVLSNIMLRRTKLECATDLVLPSRTVHLRRDVFDAREQDFYQALSDQSKAQFNGYAAVGTVLNSYVHIFQMLTRLRQAVDHPYLVVYSTTSMKDSPQFEVASGDIVCGLCHEHAKDPLTTGCQHSFCRSCIEGYVVESAELTSQCPKCQKRLVFDLNGAEASKSRDPQQPAEIGVKKSSILSRIDLRQFQTSTKIEAVKEEIYFMLEKDPGAKAIIFSQFTSMLDLIGFSLKKSGIRYVQLDGNVDLVARGQMLDAFTNDVDTRIFLMSLKAGGVALNLTMASHVFLMDPWWNPALEQQAQDRIHRIGQYKPVKVIKFVIENTIDERILELQEKKKLIFEGTIGGSSDAIGKLTEKDLQFLFTN